MSQSELESPQRQPTQPQHFGLSTRATAQPSAPVVAAPESPPAAPPIPSSTTGPASSRAASLSPAKQKERDAALLAVLDGFGHDAAPSAAIPVPEANAKTGSQHSAPLPLTAIGISGMAPLTCLIDPIEDSEHQKITPTKASLVAFDNKKKDDENAKRKLPRVGLQYVNSAGKNDLIIFTWPKDVPLLDDCEGIAATGRPGQYDLLASQGRILTFFLLQDLSIFADASDIQDFPNDKAKLKDGTTSKYNQYNFEGAQHINFSGREIICLLHRGAGNEPALLFMYPFKREEGDKRNPPALNDPASGILIEVPHVGGDIQKTAYQDINDEMLRNHRSGAELCITPAKEVYVAATYDALDVKERILKEKSPRSEALKQGSLQVGNLASAIYYVGQLRETGTPEKPSFALEKPAKPKLIKSFEGHKVEGFYRTEAAQDANTKDRTSTPSGVDGFYGCDNEEEGTMIGSFPMAPSAMPNAAPFDPETAATGKSVEK